jgi:hypothetical protein
VEEVAVVVAIVGREGGDSGGGGDGEEGEEEEEGGGGHCGLLKLKAGKECSVAGGDCFDYVTEGEGEEEQPCFNGRVGSTQKHRERERETETETERVKKTLFWMFTFDNHSFKTLFS